MADGQQGQSGQQFNTNDYYLKQQAARMLSAIQKGYNDNFPTQVSMTNSQTSGQQASVYMNHQANQQVQQQQVQQTHQQQQPQQQQQQQQQQSSSTSHQIQVQHQQLQHQLQQVQQAQQQFQQMQQLAQMQQQFQQQYSGGTAMNSGASNLVMSAQTFSPSRRGRKPTDKKKRKRHTWVKRPTTAYLYFVSKYRETLKEAGEVVPKAKIITQACAEKWRNMTEEEKEPFLELSRRDRERWQRDKALEKKPRDPNRPKRPPSAYFLFLADFRKNYPGKADPAKEITKKAGEAWNNLSDQDKTPYYRSAQVVRTQWERDLEAYKQATSVSMEQVKNGPLSRTSSLQSDPGQVELGSDSSPGISSPPPGSNNINQLSASLLQGAATSMMGTGASSQIATESDPQSPSPVNVAMGGSQLNQQSPSISSASASYVYPSHHLVAQTATLQQQFPRR